VEVDPFGVEMLERRHLYFSIMKQNKILYF